MYIADTIAAISTPHGEGGIGIVRVSGARAREVGLRIFRFGGSTTDFSSHYLHYGLVVDPISETRIDEAMAVVMQAPRSYTREDVLEIQCHGGRLVVEQVLAAALSCGARLADAGEFTRRAFLNGRIDLLEAEAVMDIISSRSESSLALARRQQEGALSRRVANVRSMLLHSLAMIEAYIDFPEDDLGEADAAGIRTSVLSACNEVSSLLSGYDEGRILRDGVAVLIVGKPNAGKSSLLNSLLGEQRAIVTHIAGTTRDIIEETASFSGLAVRLLDTAGIRQTDDLVEREGIGRALDCIPLADLVLFVLDTTRPFDDEDRHILAALAAKRVVLVCSKNDLPQRFDMPEQLRSVPCCHISTLTGAGIEELKRAILGMFIKHGTLDSQQFAVISRARHRDALVTARDILQCVMPKLNSGLNCELETCAIDVRDALVAIGQVSGHTTTDEILDHIFSSFCIGK
ncbi:MAG TPA: tRNA uridine-5-carboxymethylaminomethyl(34) synthesis GTPase MnmE [Desulfuromonadales bacterium]|nr:tRNA uridine-5-carboxymethylaminomethyl(34) synthesis GTPase MnmE [Desulfuromonadales bacterium]